MSKSQTYISIGDLIDLYYKVKQKGLQVLSGLFHVSDQNRTASKWNTHISSSDFWILPQVRRRWNEKITGDPALEYEDYVMDRYLPGGKNLGMLSVGCGTGARERKFGKYRQFDRIDGIDVAEQQIQRAREDAARANLHHLEYIAGDFTKQKFEHAPYDVILFNSSLHHFPNIAGLLQSHVLPLLKENGLLIVFEYAGPNRLQWTNEQLDEANGVLRAIPEKYRIRFQSKIVKNKIYRPGLWRVRLIDPSEAIDSENMAGALHQHFDILEEKKIGWDISHLVLKDIAHHFLDEEDVEAQNWLRFIFEKEDAYCERTGRSDALFGIYKKTSRL